MGMDSQRFFNKRFRWNRKTVHEFTSVKRLLNGHNVQPSVDLQRDVINRSIKYAFEHNDALRVLMDLCAVDRRNGRADVDVQIAPDNWMLVQGFLSELPKKLDEGDLIQYCLRFYMDEVKVKKELP
jgi:hypothetical protein